MSTFTQQIKAEALSHYEGNPCCGLAFLSAVLHTAGTLNFSDKGMVFSLSTESAECFAFTRSLLENLGAVTVERPPRKGRRRRLFTFTMEAADTRTVLREVGILTDGEEGLTLNPGVDPYLIENDCCLRNYVLGAFCGCGYAFLPKTAGSAHIEFVLKSGLLAGQLSDILAGFGISARLTGRGESAVLYIKDSRSVSDLLALLGASRAVLKFSEVLVYKEASNSVNRRNNCMLANMDKSFDASIRQIEAIRTLEETGELAALPETLQEAARLRREYPSEGLEELAERAGISKSGMNHRMRKLTERASRLFEAPASKAPPHA